MSDTSNPVDRALDSHDAFDPLDGGYDLTTTVFDALVSGEPDGDEYAFRARVTVPALDAAVAGETVAEVVELDWFETLERRVADAYDVANGATDEEVTVDRDGDAVRVAFAYAAADPEEGVADAKALIEFVEGTYVQGIVPGYEYRGPAATLLENARRRGRGGAGGDGPA